MTWKDTIPFIPVEAGVPVFPVVAGCGNKTVICIGLGRGGQNVKVMTARDGPLTTKSTNWRVDLENPLGFMYAYCQSKQLLSRLRSMKQPTTPWTHCLRQ